MGLEGFSMGNLGLNADITSAQMAVQSELLAQRDAEIKIKDVTEMAEDGGVRSKEEQSENDEQFNDGFNEKKEEENKDEVENTFSEKDFENSNPKEFSVRINQTTEMVELFNNKNNKVVETMDAKDLMGLMSKLDGAAGILVNRKI